MRCDRSLVNARYRAGIFSTLIFFACALLLPGRCVADSVMVGITDSSQTAAPGETVDFTGIITNDIEDTADFTFSFSGFDSSILTPDSLLPSPFPIVEGGVTSTIDLFSVTLSPAIGPGSYPVDFTLQGIGPGPLNETRDFTGDVTIIVTPEPSTIWLMATGLVILMATAFPGFVPKKAKRAA